MAFIHGHCTSRDMKEDVKSLGVGSDVLTSDARGIWEEYAFKLPKLCLHSVASGGGGDGVGV